MSTKTVENNVFINTILENMNDLVSDEILVEMKRRLDVLFSNYTVSQTNYAVETREEYPQSLKHFLVSKKIEGLSETTIINYKRILETFFSCVNNPVEQITGQTIQTYLYNYSMSSHADGGKLPSAHTMNQIQSVLSAFFSWCKKNGYTSKNPCESLGKIKYQKKEIDILTEEQLKKLVNATQALRNRTEQMRARALVELFISTGLRVSEALNIKLSDIKWNAPVNGLIPVKIVSGKGNKDRTVFLTDSASIAILDYIQLRNSDSEYLFVRTTNGNGQMTVRTAQNIISTLGKAIGVESCHPHMLRHSVATEMAQKGTPINLVQKMLGHSSSSTTTGYYIKAEEKQLAKEVSQKLN